MQDTKLHILLSRLSIYELNRFHKFILSPYHNEDENLIKLYQYILPLYKDGNTAALSKDKVWKRIYPGRPFANLKYARLLSDLLKKAESFVAAEKMKQQPIEESTLILEAYNEMQLSKHFTEPYLTAVKRLHVQPYRDSGFFFQSFRLNAQQNAFLENKEERTTEKNLIETINSLDSFYLINKLRYCAAILHYKHFLSIRDETILMPDILDYLTKNASVHAPVINVYHHIILTLIQPDDESNFIGLKKLLSKYMALLEVPTQKEVFDYAINYCIRKINTGKIHYQAEILELYKNALEHELLLNKGVLSPWVYKNIVTIGLRNQEYKWTNHFIESHKHKLPKAEQDNAYIFNQARYYFAIKKYDEVLQLLQSVEYSDIFYLLDSKTTLMKTYYELGEYQPLQSLKESFRILLRRKKVISEQNRMNYSNFARFAMKLYRVDTKNKAKLSALRKEIESTGNTADRSWILEKLYELQPTG